MMAPPAFVPSTFLGDATAPNFGAPFLPRPAAGYGTPPPSTPARAPLAQQQTTAPRIIRGQRPDEPASRTAPVIHPRVPLSIPSPEELGVASVKLAASMNIEWTAVHNRLNRLGATCFHLERTAQGGCRITCLLATDQQGRTHHIEAQAASEAEAVHLMLAKAEEWAGGR